LLPPGEHTRAERVEVLVRKLEGAVTEHKMVGTLAISAMAIVAVSTFGIAEVVVGAAIGWGIVRMMRRRPARG
jgi:hypothetical protein